MSVDPLADKYPGWTPYNYTMNNPIILVDPTGMEAEWHEDGDGKWVADKGDGAETLARDAGITKKEAYSIMESQGHGTYVDKNDGITKSKINPGESIDIGSAECSRVDVEAGDIINGTIDKIETQINNSQDIAREYGIKEKRASKEAAQFMNQAGGAVRGNPDPTTHVRRNFGYGISNFILAKDQYKKANKYRNKKDSVNNIIDSLRKELNKLK